MYCCMYPKSSIKRPGGLFFSSTFEGGLNRGGGGLINFPPLKRGGGGVIEDLQKVHFYTN